MIGYQQKDSRIVEANIARVLASQARTEKRWWPMTQDRAANFLADLVFVTLMLLLVVWVWLWTLVH
jgi:ribosomal protein L22